jgi:pimeloyl-ACP methyl ester carboxylesterase
MRRGVALLVALVVTLAAGGAVAPAAARSVRPVTLDWSDCGGGFQCATAEVPRDYSRRHWGDPLELAVIRRPATDPAGRVGSLFLNPGGPGLSGVALVRGSATSRFAALNRHFDLVGFDPRGVGRSRPAVRCLTDDEAKAQFSAPFMTPETLDVPRLLDWSGGWVRRCVTRNRGLLPYLATANVARDLDLLRAAVGDERLSYLGFSYGTLLGATYASMFPDRVRALALDGAVEPDVWLNRPLEATREQIAAFERSLHRFFVTCARRTWCTFGGADPERAFDRLVRRLNVTPVYAGAPYDSRPVTGDTLLVAAAAAMGNKTQWPILSGGLEAASRGTGTVLRGLADLYFGIDSKGAYDNVWDRNLAISGLDQRTPDRIGDYLSAGRHGSVLFPHFGWSTGYFEVPWALFDVRPRGVFRGPFAMPADAAPALVVGTTYDPATPYAWARRLTTELGNARLLTMDGDGHTAFFNFSPCAEKAILAYLEALEVPAEGTECTSVLDPAMVARRSTRAPVRRLAVPLRISP